MRYEKNLLFAIFLILSITISGCSTPESDNGDDSSDDGDDKQSTDDDEENPDDDHNIIDDSEITVEIIPSIPDIRHETTVIYEARGPPSNGNYTWDFGDDQILYGNLVSHRYLISDHYTITVVARWNDSVVEDQLEISVKNKDTIFMAEGTLMKVFLGQFGLGLSGEIPEGITTPTSKIYLNLTQLTNDVLVEVGIYDMDNSLLEILYNETYEFSSTDLSLSWDISEEELEPYFEERPVLLKCDCISLERMIHAEVSITIEMKY